MRSILSWILCTVVWSSLFLTADLPAAELTLPIQVIVEAGKHARMDCPVSFQFTAALPQPGPWCLVELTTAGAKPVAVQWEANDQPRASWILSGETAAGQSRRFEFRLGESPPGTDMIVDRQEDSLTIRRGESPILRYNIKHVVPPEKINREFGRSAYIHPVWTPNGAVVTDEFPPDHAHQSGIFLAYTKAVFEGRPTNFWEIKDEKGRVRFKSVDKTITGPVFGSFRVEQEHVDLTVDGGKVALHETWDVKAWQTDGPRTGFWMFDVTSTLRAATSSPLQLPTYHYGGFALRGARSWTPDVTSFLTSEKHTRADGNHTRPKWSDLTGPGNGNPAGITVLTHPTNFRFPEPVRIHPTMPYFVYTPCPLGDWSVEPGKPHMSRYRCIIHDGAPNAERLHQLWDDFAEPPQVSLVSKP